MSNATAEIFALSEGYILRVGERTLACTSLGALARAVKDELPQSQDRGQLVPFPTRPASPTPQQVRTALSPEPPAPLTPPPASSVLAYTVDQLPLPERQALYQIAHAWVTGQLPDKNSLNLNLSKYVPSLDPHAAELFLAEYIADHRADDE